MRLLFFLVSYNIFARKKMGKPWRLYIAQFVCILITSDRDGKKIEKKNTCWVACKSFLLRPKLRNDRRKENDCVASKIMTRRTSRIKLAIRELTNFRVFLTPSYIAGWDREKSRDEENFPCLVFYRSSKLLYEDEKARKREFNDERA